MKKDAIKSENLVKHDLLKKLGKRHDVRIFRNNVGMAVIGSRIVRFGLFKGSGDFIGWKEVIVTNEMVGKKIAVFLSIETKRKGGHRTKEQLNWCDQVNSSGGIAIFADGMEPVEL